MHKELTGRLAVDDVVIVLMDIVILMGIVVINIVIAHLCKAQRADRSVGLAHGALGGGRSS